MSRLGLAEVLLVLQHAGLIEREEATGMTLRLTAIGLLSIADPEHGCVLADMKQLKATLYPKQGVSLGKHLDELRKAGVVKRRKKHIYINLSADREVSVSDGAVVREAFDHWKEVMGKTRSALSIERATAIRDRLAEGYTIDDIKQAITGCSKSSFHMGSNDRNTRYDDLTLICRSAEHLERFMQITPGVQVGQRSGEAVIRRGLDD